MKKIVAIGYVWKSQQNGAVYDVEGVSPCLACGQHSGVEPKIMEIVYESETDRESASRPARLQEQDGRKNL